MALYYLMGQVVKLCRKKTYEIICISKDFISKVSLLYKENQAVGILLNYAMTTP